MYVLLGHSEDFAFYSKYNTKSLKGYKPECNISWLQF